jgi:hypothetical protein
MPLTPTLTTYTQPEGVEGLSYFQDCPVDVQHINSGELYLRFDPVNFPQRGIKSASVAAPSSGSTDTEYGTGSYGTGVYGE